MLHYCIFALNGLRYVRYATNTPLSRSNNPMMRSFLRNRVVNGGAIPGHTQLQERYLPEVYKMEKNVIKDLISDKPVSVLFDETPDVEGPCVLNIMVSPLIKDESGKIRSYLIDTVILDKCNHSTVANAAVSALNEFGVKQENVISFDTDNA